MRLTDYLFFIVLGISAVVAYYTLFHAIYSGLEPTLELLRQAG